MKSSISGDLVQLGSGMMAWPFQEGRKRSHQEMLRRAFAVHGDVVMWKLCLG